MLNREQSRGDMTVQASSSPSAQTAASGVRVKQPRARLLPAIALVIAAAAVMPIAALLWIALTGSHDDWPHLVSTVLPRATGRTLALLALNGAVTAAIGILTAWLVAACDFPFRRALSVLLVLPLAMPAYLAAYAFGEFFDFTGPVQSGLRALFGFRTVKDYWFPDIRSLGGAVLVMSAVLYPYIYLACRSMLLMQGRAAADVARTLGAGPLRVFFKVQIPMARPAIIVGLTLVMMESLNDIGAVEYLGVNTLTFAIYDTWLNRGSLTGAAQMAVLMLVFVVALIVIERAARRRQRFAGQKTTAMVHDAVRLKLTGWRRWAAVFACVLPVLFGFVIPVLVLGGYAIKRLPLLMEPRLLNALGHSLMVAGMAALVTVVLGFTLAWHARAHQGRLVKGYGRLASLGYGVPGTVLAIGVLFPLASLDNTVDGFFRANFGFGTGLLLSGTGFAIVYACMVRFMAMAEGTIDAGFHKLSPHLDMAARTLGRTGPQTLVSILIPNMRPAILTGALLVFIETLKELSATILLRPFNFNTLATLVYEDASRAKVEDASVPALIIILAGLVPVLLVSRSIDRR